MDENNNLNPNLNPENNDLGSEKQEMVNEELKNVDNSETELNTNEPLSGEEEKKPAAEALELEPTAVNEQENEGKSKKGLVLGVFAVVVVIALAAAYFFMNNPKNKVARAFENTFKSSCEESSLGKILGLSEVSRTISEGKAVQDIQFNIKNAGDSLAPEGLGFGIEAKTDMNAQKAQGKVNVLYKNEILGDLDFYIDSEQVMASVPVLLDDYYYAKVSELDNFYDTKFGKMLKDKGYDDIDFSEIGKNPFESFAEAYIKESTEIGRIYDEAEVTEAEPAVYKIGEKEESCEGYKLKIKKESMVAAFNEFLDKLKNNEDIRSYYELSLSKERADEFFENIDELQASLDENLTDVEVYAYIYDGKVVALKYEKFFEENSMSDGVRIEAALLGDEHIFDNWFFEVELISKHQNIVVRLENESTESESSIDTYAFLSMQVGDDEAQDVAAFGLSYAKDTNEFEASLMIIDEYGDKTLEINGECSEISKGKALKVDVENISLRENDEELMSFDGHYYFNELNEDITVPSDNAVNLLDLGEEDFNKIFEEVEEKAKKLSSKFSALM